MPSSSAASSLITSDYVVAEFFNLLNARGKRRHAETLWPEFRVETPARVIHVTDDDFKAAGDLMVRYRDKHWSFTDCTSFVVMQRLDVQDAFAFDDHFRQLGTVTVVP